MPIIVGEILPMKSRAYARYLKATDISRALKVFFLRKESDAYLLSPRVHVLAYFDPTSVDQQSQPFQWHATRSGSCTAFNGCGSIQWVLLH